MRGWIEGEDAEWEEVGYGMCVRGPGASKNECGAFSGIEECGGAHGDVWVCGCWGFRRWSGAEIGDAVDDGVFAEADGAAQRGVEDESVGAAGEGGDEPALFVRVGAAELVDELDEHGTAGAR